MLRLVFVSLSGKEARCEQMNWQIESITPTAEPVFPCGLVMVLREMHSALVSRIYTTGAQHSASGAVFPDAPSAIPNLRADFLHFTSKAVEV
jgi:hypothetical protein